MNVFQVFFEIFRTFHVKIENVYQSFKITYSIAVKQLLKKYKWYPGVDRGKGLALWSLLGGGIRYNIIFTINYAYKKCAFIYIPTVCKKHDFVLCLVRYP